VVALDEADAALTILGREAKITDFAGQSFSVPDRVFLLPENQSARPLA
jgi:hypothetical protein